ncbi:MAG: glutamine amidotransferase [Rhodanobacteraceae bacterium]|nr:MAG: glutamine amidotransferase [Rhodanobacteraceae bacterium]
MRPLLLIQTGEAPEAIHARFGGFADWFRHAMRLEPTQLRVVRVDAGEPLPRPREVAGAVITGSAAMVTERADWSERTAGWIRDAVDTQTPLFGVCYGHQLMAHALGGTVGWLPHGREIGTQTITRQESSGRGREIGTHTVTRGGNADGGWMDGLPVSFAAHTTHRQSVLVPPPDAEVLARSELDPYQMLRHAPHAFSSQFHPEFTAAAMRAYIVARTDALREEGLDPVALEADVRETEAARALLERFAHKALASDEVRAIESQPLS